MKMHRLVSRKIKFAAPISVVVLIWFAIYKLQNSILYSQVRKMVILTTPSTEIIQLTSRIATTDVVNRMTSFVTSTTASVDVGNNSLASLKNCTAYYPLQINISNVAEEIRNGKDLNLTIINPHPFYYMHNPKRVCVSGGGNGRLTTRVDEHHNVGGDSKNERLRLLIIVKSAVENYVSRRVIRNTWGQKIKTLGIKCVFILGFSPQLQTSVDFENHLFHDIIQGNFVDNYRNNTYKTIMAYNWITKYCPNVEKILFLDDDIYLNILMLENILKRKDIFGDKAVFSGLLNIHEKPERSPNSKWHVTHKEYPCNKYPPYLAGMAILASIDIVKLFQGIFPYVKYFAIDDVYLGIVALKLGIKPTNNSYVENLTNLKKLPELMANHGFRDHDFYRDTYRKMAYQGKVVNVTLSND